MIAKLLCLVKNRCWLGVGFVLAALTLTTFALWRHHSQAAAAPPPAAPALQVHALGRLEPQSRVLRLAAPSSAPSARLARLSVREGDRVTAGQVLAVLDSSNRLHSVVEEAEAKLVVAQARLRQLRAGAKPGEIAAQEALVARADTSVAWLEREYRRAETLLASKSIAVAEYEQRRAELKKGRDELEQAQANLHAVREVRSVDVQVLEAEVRAAESALKRARHEAADAELRAPLAGTVLKIHVFPGEVVGARGIMEIGDVAQMFAVAQVYEADIMRLHVGDRARVRVASTKLELDGTVAEIGRLVGRKDVLDNDPVADTDARVVEVRIRLAPEGALPVASLSNARVNVMIAVSGR